jgi:phosphoribosylformimino-5-aminoimidazole carboxamide ribotide isomerase
MTRFRPCIDLHSGKVKQIVGGSFSNSGEDLKTNYISEHPAAWYAGLYKKDNLAGGHIIMLGEGNEGAALEALRAFSEGLQIGGGIRIENAEFYLLKGASHVIVTSWLIPQDLIDWNRLKQLSHLITKKRLVLDLSCRKLGDSWFISKNKWQTITKEEITESLIKRLQEYCDEFLIHAADIEGKCRGVDEKLVELLGSVVEVPTTYAGGAKHISDLDTVSKLSEGKVDLSIGSALDIFGGRLINYRDCVAFNQQMGLH